MSKEAMKLALEALLWANNEINEWRWETHGSAPEYQPVIMSAIAGLKAAQAAQQEPVGRLESDPDEGHVFVPRIYGDWSMLGKDLYTSPTSHRTWVGLTNEEKIKCASPYDSRLCCVEETEAKLMEKNNGNRGIRNRL